MDIRRWLPPLLFLIGFGLLYSTTLSSIHHFWAKLQGHYSHGYLLFAISIYILWQRRNNLFYEYDRTNHINLSALALFSVVWMLSAMASIQVVQQLAVLAIVFFFIASAGGNNSAKSAAFPLALLLFAIPFWGYLIPVLQSTTTAICQTGLAILEIPALVESNYITVPAGAFYVSGGCSGLNYLLVALSLAALQSHFFGMSPKQSIVLLLLAALMALVCNWIRVLSIIIIGYVTDMQSGLIEDHYAFGWILFAAAYLILVYFSRNWHRSKESSRNTDSPSPDSRKYHTSKKMTLTPKVTALALALYAPITLIFLNDGSDSHEMANHFAPVTIDGWQESSPSHNWQPTIINPDFKQDLFFHKEGRKVSLHVYGYLREEQGKEIINFYNKIANEEWRRAGAPKTKQNDIKSAILASPSGKLLIYYWYDISGHRATSTLQAKLAQIYGYFTQNRTASLIAIATECKSDCLDEHSYLKDFYTKYQSLGNHSIN